MSGFEVAGVVLGSLPLVISAVEHYADLVRTVKRAIKYQTELRNLKHSLDAEATIFLDTLERVLDGLIPAAQLEELLKEPGSKLWQDESLNQGLKDRLGRSYKVFTHTVNDMNDTVQEFMKRLDLDEKGRVRWTESTGLKLALKRAGFSLRKRDFDDLIDQLQKHNRYIEKFTNRSIEFEPIRRKRIRSSKLQKLGEYAKSAFHALEASFGCNCRGSDCHTALLGISPQNLTSSKRQDKIELQVVLSGVLSASSNSTADSVVWQETSLQPLEENKAQTQAQAVQCPPTPGAPAKKSVKFFQALHTWNSSSQSTQSTQSTSQTTLIQTTSTTISVSPPQPQPNHTYIPSMCKIIHTSSPHNHLGCLGYIAHGDRKFLLHTLARSSSTDQQSWSVVSLRQVLQKTVVSAPPLTPWDRLTLAATIASAVLQLHASPWLKSAWDNNDVLFLQRKGDRLYKQAFISKSVPADPNTTPTSPSPFSIFNETLLTLAIILVELSIGPLEKLQTTEDLRAGICANMVTLWRLVENDEIGVVFGPKYQAAVKRCIELAKASSCLDERIQQDLYEGVVAVLEDQATRKNSAP